MAETPEYLKLALPKGPEPDPRKGSSWGQASGEQKNSWVRTTIEHLLKNHAYSTVYALTIDVHEVLQRNSLFILGKDSDYTYWIDHNPGVTTVATELFKAKQAQTIADANSKTSDQKSKSTDVYTENKKKSDNYLMIGIGGFAALILLISIIYLSINSK